MYFTNFALYMDFIFCEIFLFISFTRSTVLGGRNYSWILFKESKLGCAAQLSIISQTFFDYRCNSTSLLISHFIKISDDIQPFLFAKNSNGELSVPITFKHPFLAYFPVTNSFLTNLKSSTHLRDTSFC
jgi:hypothetical protein